VTHPKLAKLRRLERLLPAHLEAKRKQDEAALAHARRQARDAMIRLGAVMLYGDPKLDEPLSLAWERCLALVGVKPDLGPDETQLFHRLMTDISGANEAEKFECVLSKAPVWLLRFTRARRTAALLGIACPELSAAPAWGREGWKDARNWPMLPKGTLQAGDPMVEPIHNLEDSIFLLELYRKDETQWTRHEHRRYNEILDTEVPAAPLPGG
jgi:hypothetical protein